MVKAYQAIVLLLFLVINTSAAYAEVKVSASVDKNPVMLGESLILTVVANGDVEQNALDTSPLLKGFTVGRTSVSSQTSMVNFKTSYSTRWTTVLLPKQLGKVIIPALKVADSYSNEITVTVVKADKNGQEQRDLFISTEASNKEVYVQQQLSLTVKLHFAAELQRGSLTEPSMPGADIKQLGQDQESESIINGRRYRIIERTYRINPQKSGDFTLKAPIFSGEILVPSKRNRSFFGFNETKPVSVVGEDIKVKVKAKPDNYSGHWLPSELLTLHQEWQPSNSNFMVGEPITRTITLTAAGVAEEQLPDLTLSLPKGIKVYPDQAESHTGVTNKRLVSQKIYNFALVASKPGQYLLPEIRIPWWNTVTNKYQEAVLASQSITVEANPEFANDTAPARSATEQTTGNKEATPKLTPNSENNTAATHESTEPVILLAKQNNWLQWLFLALWLITCLAWFVSSRRLHKQPTDTDRNLTSNTSAHSHYQALMTAAKASQGEQVLTLIPTWVNAQTSNSKPVYNITEAIKVINQANFTEQVTQLQASYFSKQPQPWSGDKLAKIVKHIQQSPNNNKQAIDLRLNP